MKNDGLQLCVSRVQAGLTPNVQAGLTPNVQAGLTPNEDLLRRIREAPRAPKQVNPPRIPRSSITPSKRPPPISPEQKREICLARLRECREQPPRMNWTLAREQKGIRTAFKKYFTAAEQARIKAAYAADEPLDLTEHH